MRTAGILAALLARSRFYMSMPTSRSAGRYRERFDFSHLASGLYFYDIQVDGPGGTLFRDVRQFILLK